MRRPPLLPAALVAAALFIASPTPGQAQLTARQAIARRALSDPQWQPHGTRIAVTVSEHPHETSRPRHIWMADAATGSSRQLTSSDKSEWSPRWSPDGRTLAFLSDRGKGTQVWLLPMDGGEALPLTSEAAIHARVSEFAWAPDGKHIALAARDLPDSATDARRKVKDDAIVVDHDDAPSRVWIVDVATKAAHALTKGPWDARGVQWTPDGTRLVVTATDKPASDQYTNAIYSVAVDGPNAGTLVRIAAPRGPFGNVSVSNDGARIAWIGARVDGPTPHDLYVASLDGKDAPRNVTASTLDRLIGDYTWNGDGSFTAIAHDGFTSGVRVIGFGGNVEPMLPLPVNVTSFDRNDAGDLAFIGEKTTVAPELWVERRGQSPLQLTHVNDDWNSVAVAAPTFLHWKAPDGLSIEGALLLPPGHAAGERLPTIVLVHGGPAGAWSDSFESWGQMLVSRGYAVLYPNPRGSTGYGQAFLEANRGDWGGGDYKDIMAGVDALVRSGTADSTRLGIGGWSYGGYMSEWAITQTHRFDAAIAGAGLSDLAAEFGTESNSAYDEWYYGLPYEQPAGFAKSSPLTYIRNAKTPTLILQGEADVTDPIGQSTALYRALKRYNVPSELVLYPREGHGLSEEKHLVDRLNRVVEWYQRWVR
jgi:dipeptidyl aminopeptidase/acylaminoacyl peptidase